MLQFTSESIKIALKFLESFKHCLYVIDSRTLFVPLFHVCCSLLDLLSLTITKLL